MLGLLVVGILIAGSSPGYGQEPEPGATPAVPVLNGNGLEVVPIVTRGGVHDDFGRMVFDWPWAVAYGARIEGKKLTVMFDRRLHTTFQEIPRNLGAYITDVDLGPDGQSVVAALTNEYRLRTFLLNNEDGGVKVVVDLLADGGAGPMLAQAPTLPSVEPSPAAVPGDAPSPPTISGDSLPLPPSLPFAVEADAPPEIASESSPPESGENPPRPYGPPLPRGDEDEHPLLGGKEETCPPNSPQCGTRFLFVPRQRRGGSTPAQSLTPDPSGEQTTGQNVDQAATPALGMEPELAGEEPTPAPSTSSGATPPGRGAEISPSVKADADTPPAESDSSPESVPTAEAPPPVETTAVPEPDTEPAPEAAPPAETATAPEAEAPSEETSPAEPDATPETVTETASEDAPPAEPTQETAPETSPPGRPVLSPVEGGAAQRRGGSTDAPPSPPDSNEEQLAEQSEDRAAVPPLEAETEPVGEEPTPALRATPPERGEEAAPPAEPTPETASEDPPPVTTDPNLESPTPDQHPTPDQAGHPQGGAPTPNPQFPTLPVSVRIPVSQSQLFRLDTPVASVFVANPDIADVQLVSSAVLFVVAKAVGRTSVAALDADSELVGEWTIATVLDIQPARAAIEGVPTLKNVAVRQLNRGVELSGTVASIAAADLALRLTTTALPEETPVENRISVTGKQQVNLEVQIAEVQRSVSETLGFNWEVLPDIGGGRDLAFRVGRTFLGPAGAYLVSSLPDGTAAHLAGSTGIAAGRTTVRGLIDALASAGLATVLARPNVTAISGETASFFSGGEYPLPAGFEDGAIIFEYKKYGVLLDFVPTIIDNGRIMLTVRPEVSQRSDTDSLTVTGIDIPVINVRRAETTVEVGNGESIVIAGLYRDQSEAVEAGLPVVKDIPLLGMLFGTQSVRSNATELIVVVTARLTTATTMPRTTDRDRQLPGRRLRGYHY